MIRVHPRERDLADAEMALTTAYLQIVRTYGLTTAEELRICATFVEQRVGGIAKYAIRQERHGSTDKPGGVE